MVEDGEMLSHDVLDTDVLPPFGHVNPEARKDGHNFKYDQLLKELELNETNIIQRILTFYDKEMNMFGYQWDNTGQKSLCNNWDESGECC